MERGRSANIRAIRREIARDDNDRIDEGMSAMVMQFGQFIAHDLSSVLRYRQRE